MNGKMTAGVVTGVIGGVVWQNGIRFAILLFFLFVGHKPYAARLASSCGLLAAFVMLTFYILKATDQSSVFCAWGKNILHIAYSLVFCGSASGMVVAINARLVYRDNFQGLLIIAGSFTVGAVLYLLGRVLLNKAVQEADSVPRVKFLDRGKSVASPMNRGQVSTKE